MTAEEAQEITQTIIETLKADEGTNGPIYVLIATLVTAGPIAMRYFRKMHEKSILKIINPFIKQMEEIATMMHLHIETLGDAMDKHSELKDSHEELKQTVKGHEEHIKSFKDKIKDIC